ncbi:MAG: DUF4829 domain-containing protein [Clostridium sp.]|uniref:DUF4829 domain-containing protein n=1 Tax=Clostridium sp. TaxID=1506 RepID=UPI003F35F58C
MKLKKILLPILIIIGFILGLSGLYLYNKDVSTSNTVNDSELKEAAIRKFYSSYSNKSIDIFNDSVIDSYKITTDESKELRNLLYEDLISFKLLEVSENKDSSITSIDGISYDKENIAEFIVNYDIDFDKGVYGTAGEGKQSVRKVIVRKDKKSPWLVAGQIDGHGY